MEPCIAGAGDFSIGRQPPPKPMDRLPQGLASALRRVAAGRLQILPWSVQVQFIREAPSRHHDGNVLGRALSRLQSWVSSWTGPIPRT